MTDEAVLIREIRDHLSDADLSARSADAHYREAGARLLELHKLYDDAKKAGKKQVPWATYVRQKCGVEKTRAYELMKLANDNNGVKLRKMRSKDAAKKRKQRKKNRPGRPGQFDNVVPLTASQKRKFWKQAHKACDWDPRVKDSNEGAKIARRRGFLYCAEESTNYAQPAHNPLIGSLAEVSANEIDSEIIEAAEKAAAAWSDVVEKLHAKRRYRGVQHTNGKTKEDGAALSSR